MRYLLDHPEVCEQMGRKAREHVRAIYDRKNRIQKTLEYYERGLRARGM